MLSHQCSANAATCYGTFNSSRLVALDAGWGISLLPTELSTAADVAWFDWCLRFASGQDQIADSLTALRTIRTASKHDYKAHVCML